MTLLQSHMMPLGTPAPHFGLPDALSGQTIRLDETCSERATVVMFICNHCPYVKHIQSALVTLANDYQPLGVRFIAINSNDALAYPEDSPEGMRKVAEELQYSFPYVYDESQSIAKAYQAVCTPDFFVFDNQLACVYRGRLGASTPGNGLPVTGKDLRAALDALLGGQPVNADQHPSMGCSIKWRK